MIKTYQKFYLFVFIIIASNSFYQFKPFQEYEPRVKFVYYLFVFAAIVLACVLSLNTQGKINSFLVKKQPTVFVIALFAVCLISVFNTFVYKDQPITIGLMTSLQTLSVYIFFFALIKIGLSVDQFEKLVVLFGITYVIVLLISYVTLPNPLFGRYGFEEGRGGVRLRLPGYFWTVALYFYSIQKFKEKAELKNLSLIVLCFFATVLSFARQYLFYSVVLGLLFYFTGVPLKKKLNIIILGLILFLFVIPNTQLYQNYSSLTQEQLERNNYQEEDVRVKDYRVFLFDYPRSTMQYLFGCGQGSYGNSRYGDELEMLVREEQLIQADAGWAGFVFYYGYVGVALLLIIILKSLFLNCSPRYYYLKYIILYMSLCAILGGTILYYNEYLLIFLSIYILSRVSSMGRFNYLMAYVIIRKFCISLYRKKLFEVKR